MTQVIQPEKPVEQSGVEEDKDGEEEEEVGERERVWKEQSQFSTPLKLKTS